VRDGTHLRETIFSYDQFNRQLSRTLPGGATETWQYNTLGQLTQHVDFKVRRKRAVTIRAAGCKGSSGSRSAHRLPATA